MQLKCILVITNVAMLFCLIKDRIDGYVSWICIYIDCIQEIKEKLKGLILIQTEDSITVFVFSYNSRLCRMFFNIIC